MNKVEMTAPACGRRREEWSRVEARMSPKKKTLEGVKRARGGREARSGRYQNRKENSRKSDDDGELRGTAEENEKEEERMVEA